VLHLASRKAAVNSLDPAQNPVYLGEREPDDGPTPPVIDGEAH